ncbi:MAG: hypothetical protein ACW981_11900 [Candidatus Hodarchaeales archaeon]|jgi:hypothetical protein
MATFNTKEHINSKFTVDKDLSKYKIGLLYAGTTIASITLTIAVISLISIGSLLL